MAGSSSKKEFAPGGVASCGTDKPATDVKHIKESHERLKCVDHADIGYRIERVTSLETLKKVFELRYDVYCLKLHAFPPNELEMETDVFDTVATHFAAFNGDDCVGSVRLVPEFRDIFPMEEHGFHLPSSISRPHAVEVSRIIALPKGGHSPAVDLIRSAYDWSIDHHMTNWIYSANRMTLAFMQKNGFIGDSIGEPEFHHNDTYYPFVMPLTDSFRFPW